MDISDINTSITLSSISDMKLEIKTKIELLTNKIKLIYNKICEKHGNSFSEECIIVNERNLIFLEKEREYLINNYLL